MNWRVNVPKKPKDSSGGAELLQLTHATKEAVGLRLQFAELGAPLNVPTVIDVDATAALAGPLRDRVGRGSRYLAARLAMVRQGIQDGLIAPTKVPGVGHRADGFTKPLTGAAFREFAAANLGVDTSDLIAPGPTQAGNRNTGSSGGPGTSTGGGATGTGGRQCRAPKYRKRRPWAGQHRTRPVQRR
jgi:hypothetical protein